MKFRDKRSKKIVFVSHCIINSNNKFPGCADVPGAYTDFMIPIMESGIGIFQMSCCEVLGWGGVGRTRIEFDLDPDNLDQDWIKDYPKLGEKWALWTADRFEDYITNGYEVLGIIHVADSPTCGLDHVDPFPQIHLDLLEQGFDWNDIDFDVLIGELETPEEMVARGASGKGAFAAPLRDELQRRGYDVPWLPYVPTKSMKEQTEMILDSLEIEITKE